MTYAVPGSYRDASIELIVPQGNRLGMELVTLVHVVPPSRVTCTRPSFVPAHRIFPSSGDSAIENTTPAYSTPMLSGVRPPEIIWRDLSLRVRSGEIVCHVMPLSVLICTNWLPT